MTIIVEDGTGVTNANSYITVDEARSYAAARGYTFPSVDADAEKYLIQANDYIESFRRQFWGSKTDPTQPLQWPRTGAQVDGVLIGTDVIPSVLKQAQAQLSVDAISQDLMPTGAGREVVAEKVDVLEVRYAESGITNVQPQLTKAKALLQPLLKHSLDSGILTVRV